MNAKILFAATLAASLASSLALADEAPLSRAQVKAELAQATANGTLSRSDYDFDVAQRNAVSTKSRAQVLAELADAKRANPLLVGESARSRTYNPFGTALLEPSAVSRTEVKAEVLQAQRNGTLQHSDYDANRPLGMRRVASVQAEPVLAQSAAPTTAR